MKNAIVGQSGGPTSAINSTLAGVISKSKEMGIDKLYGMHFGLAGLLNDDIAEIDDIIGEGEVERLKTTPASYLGSCRLKLPTFDTEPKIYETIMSILDKYSIKYFFYIGGNDSMDTILKLSEYCKKISRNDIMFVGVPKTIDNDLVMTDHTPGYGSAAKYIATSVSEIAYDCSVYDIPAVTIIEIMGRDSGWLTASAGLAMFKNRPASDLIYLPEVPFSDDKFFSDVKKCLSVRPNVVVAVSEGIKYQNGKYVGESSMNGISDVFGHKYLSGTGKSLEYKIREKFGIKSRAVEINLLQRCAAHLLSLTDINESFETGEKAVEAALSGKSGIMITTIRADSETYRVRFSFEDVRNVANKVKTMPSDFINQDKNHITDKCFDYIHDLIAGECKIEYSGGLPLYLGMKKP